MGLTLGMDVSQYYTGRVARPVSVEAPAEPQPAAGSPNDLSDFPE